MARESRVKINNQELTTLETARVHVVNRKSPQGFAAPPGSCREVYIGRPSIFGNPYRLSTGEARGSTLERYEAYLRGECVTGGRLKDAILELALLVPS